MDHVSSNPYAAPETMELPTVADVPFVCPNLSKFLWRGFCAALLIAPFNVAYQLFQQSVGINYLGSTAYVASSSVVSIALVALGDGLIAMMCWQLFRGRDRMLIIFVATAGLRVLAVLCQSFLFLGLPGNTRSVWHLLLFSLHYGPPPVLITLLFMQLLNRRGSWWVYPSVYFISTIAVTFLQSTIRLALAAVFGAVNAGALTSLLLLQSVWLCVLAATLWFGLRLSRSAVTRSASCPSPSQ
jgi:hypothetical protein